MIDTTQLNAEMTAKYGRDVRITLARQPRWGHMDYCLLINGRNHKHVMRELASRFHAATLPRRKPTNPRHSPSPALATPSSPRKDGRKHARKNTPKQ